MMQADPRCLGLRVSEGVWQVLVYESTTKSEAGGAAAMNACQVTPMPSSLISARASEMGRGVARRTASHIGASHRGLKGRAPVLRDLRRRPIVEVNCRADLSHRESGPSVSVSVSISIEDTDVDAEVELGCCS
ncbi:hypothetical protein EYF80_023172 [Liparis tanakae]|uniref:Uncharacterized protein n=1 Tax=Liparis tanakae TaxID=230148 RepID=A0A4Z2HLA4_9TELE|nr:hypothetical protein EYF80_023172 [Liparis tanakae]